MTKAAQIRERALAAARGGDHASAARLFAGAAASFPLDAALLNSAGNFHAGIGDPAMALDYFDRALKVDCHYGEAAINRAVVLTRLGDAHGAISVLEAGRSRWKHLPRYWTTRGAAEIENGDKAAAANSYDQALLRDPNQVRALTGRARVALERGEGGAVERHERALAAQPGDAHLLLGAADALDLEGRSVEAGEITAMLATQLPSWLPGMERHAAHQLSIGDRDGFCGHYALVPHDSRSVDFYLSWAAMLAGVGRPVDAAAVTADGRRQFRDDPDLALALASHLDAAGDHHAAAEIFARTRRSTMQWRLHEARHLLRRGDPAAADALLATALVENSDDVVGWSLRDIAWRLLGDQRHEWLSGQPGLVGALALDISTDEITTLVATLDRLHDRSATPIGQSVRSGSQTRGALLERVEPIFARAAGVIREALDRYRAGLPAADPAHPLLRHRDARWSIAGSWSIRMVGRGRHAAHIHPQGIISSAAYIVVPDATRGGNAGWLELGRPPTDLGSDLPAQMTIEPQVGQVALFPSTLYHATRPIDEGRRMTIAFDVKPS